jgi:hypothetical protein
MTPQCLSPAVLSMPAVVIEDPVRTYRRKRARFTEKQEDHDENENDRNSDSVPVQSQVVELLLPSSEMTLSERSEIWYNKSDYRSSLQTAEQIGRAAANDHDSGLFMDTLAKTYAICCLENNNNGGSSSAAGDDIMLLPETTLDLSHPLDHHRHHLVLSLSDHCAQQLAMVSVVSGDEKCHRGLERVTVPAVGLEIVRRRKQVISAVVLAQRNLRGLVARKDEKLEALRTISEHQSLPARKFAKAMGVVDAMGALLEYQTP